MPNFVVITVPANGLAPSGARPDVGTEMTKFGAHIHMRPTFEG